MYHDSIPPIHRAALDGDKAIVQQLCNSLNNTVDVLNSESELPIFSALFLPAGAMNVLKQDKIDIFRYLTERTDSSLLFHKNTIGETILHRIAKNGFEELVTEVVQQAPTLLHTQREDGMYPIHVAVLNGRMGVVQQLLLPEASVAQQRDADGNLPLHLAAAYGSVEMVSACFEAFPDGVNQSNARSQTPLDLAKENNNIAAFNYLMGKNGKEDPMNRIVNTQSPSPMG